MLTNGDDPELSKDQVPSVALRAEDPVTMIHCVCVGLVVLSSDYNWSSPSLFVSG